MEYGNIGYLASGTCLDNNDGTIHNFFLGKPAIFVAIFNSYVINSGMTDHHIHYQPVLQTCSQQFLQGKVSHFRVMFVGL